MANVILIYKVAKLVLLALSMRDNQKFSVLHVICIKYSYYQSMLIFMGNEVAEVV